MTVPPEPLDTTDEGIREAAIANLRIRCGHRRELAAQFADIVLEAVTLRIAAAERDRIRQLAEEHQAVTRRRHRCQDPDCPALETDQAFADLLREDQP